MMNVPKNISMRVNKFNGEGYADPTAYAALIRILKQEVKSVENDNLHVKVRRERKLLRVSSKTDNRERGGFESGGGV